MEVVLSTRNPSKAEQIKAVFAGSPIQIITLSEAGIDGQGVEDGTTLRENALKKAMFVHQQNPNVWAMADDSGIFIDALGGKPGVHTADWLGGKIDPKVKLPLILRELEKVNDRSATFRTVVAIVNGNSENSKRFFVGEVRGTLLLKARCEPQPQMPRSAIFLPDGSDKVFAEMTTEEENVISHRGKAFHKVRTFLENSKRVGSFYY